MHKPPSVSRPTFHEHIHERRVTGYTDDGICAHCKKPYRYLYSVHDDAVDRYPYLTTDEEVCYDCIRTAEWNFVVNMPIEDVPLWMGHSFIMLISYTRYKKRLDKLMGV